jgi:NAD(P)-dependent dehydrogenase (short-subunit alcohol dehydrogenase family)
MTTPTPTTGGARTWLITGISSGFGKAIAEAALAAGDCVIGTARKAQVLEAFAALAPGRSHALQLDVTDPAAVTATVERALSITGRIDVLVNNAGYALVGALEEAGEAQFHRQMETNLFGAWRMAKAVLPQMRRQGAGRIFNITSVAGMIASPGLGCYAASKFALEGLSEALAAEVAPLGIRVSIIEPGAFRTEFAGDSSAYSEPRIADYDATAGRMRAMLSQYHHQQPGDPARLAQVLLQLVDMPEPPLRLVLGSDVLPRVRQKLDHLKSELGRWEALTLSTDFPR